MEALPPVNEVIIEDTQVLNDQAMKELADQLMEKFNDCEYLTKKLSRENLNLKKDIMTLYGLIRSLDTLIDGMPIDPVVSNFVDVMRGIASEYIEEYCLEKD